MKNTKKVLSGLLSCACAATFLAGCGSTKDTSKAPSADGSKELEHMEISIAFWDVDTFLAGDPILEKLEEKFNFEFVPMNITWDDYNTKEQLWASTDSLPDIFATDCRTTSTFPQWAKDGVIREIPSDLSAYPNLEKYLSGDAASSCMVDDKMYCIFRQTYNEQAETVKDRFLVYRWDLAQKAGITEKPTDWDSFRKTIQAIIKADPEGKHIGGMTAPGMGYLVGPTFCYSMPNAVVDGATFKWVDRNGTYIPAYFDGETWGADALPTWQLLRDMYTEGSIDQDIALSTLEQSKNKFLNGQSAALCITAGPLDQIGDAWPDLHGSEMMDDVAFMPLMPGANGETYYWAWDYAWSESMFSANVDDEKMDRILMIYDYLLSDEGILNCKYGVEGETYNVVDGELQFVNDVNPMEVYPSLQVLGCLASWNPKDPNGYKQPSPYPEWLLDAQDDLVEQAKKCELPETNPACTMEFIALGSDFGLHIQDDALLITTGDRPVEEMWNEILEEYKKDGVDDCIEKVNAAVKG